MFEKAYGEPIPQFEIKDAARIADSVVEAVRKSVWTTSNRATTCTASGSRAVQNLHKFDIDDKEPKWKSLPQQSGRFLTYKPPVCIDDIVNDVPLERNKPEKALILVAQKPFAHGEF